MTVSILNRWSLAPGGRPICVMWVQYLMHLAAIISIAFTPWLLRYDITLPEMCSQTSQLKLPFS